MKNTSSEFITLQEAAELSQKAEQTIRRAIKSKKIGVKKQKTPQGFVYLVDKASIIKVYKREISEDKKKKQVSTNQTTSQATSRVDEELTSQKSNKKAPSQNEIEPIKKSKTELSTDNDAVVEFQKLLRNIVEQHQAEREHSSRFLRELQDKVMFLEHQLMQLQAPKKKWWKLWK